MIRSKFLALGAALGLLPLFTGCFLFVAFYVIAADVAVTTDQDTPLTIDLLTYITLKEATLTGITITQPANGTAVLNPDNTVTYTPDPGYNGADAFTYTANAENVFDATQTAMDTGTVNITVNPVAPPPPNNPPTAQDDAFIDPPSGVLDVVVNDSDPDGDTLTISSTTAGANGTAAIVTGNPDFLVFQLNDPLFEGTDTFTYEISDGNGGTATATVDLTFQEFTQVKLGFVNETANQVTITLDFLDKTGSAQEVIVLEPFETLTSADFVISDRGQITGQVQVNANDGVNTPVETFTYNDDSTNIITFTPTFTLETAGTP